MVPRTVKITENGYKVYNNILVPSVTSTALTLPDERQLFVPPGVYLNELLEPTLFQEDVLDRPVTVSIVRDESKKLEYPYLHIEPSWNTATQLVYLEANLPKEMFMLLFAGTDELKEPFDRLLPSQSTQAHGRKVISQLFEVPEGKTLYYTVFCPQMQHVFVPILFPEHKEENG